jgi:Uma2 family endonuclease
MSALPTNPGRTPAPFVPPLENGDRLTREEFERRYRAMPHLKKAELIDGIVYMPSPVRLHRHGQPHVHLITWIGTYHATTPGTFAGDNSTARLDLDNEPQPDALLMIDPARGGQAKISDDDYVEGGPELVCEVAASSVSIDLHRKLEAYRRNGVREYIVRITNEPDVRWFVLKDGQFQQMPPDAQGLLRSQAFPGLWLDPAALLRGDLLGVLEVLRRGMDSPEHAAFVQKLSG